MALVKALRGFGVLENVLEQVQTSFVPPKRNAGSAGEKALSDSKAQLHIIRQRLAKQRTAVSNAQEALVRSQEKLTGLEDEVAKLDLRYRELSVDPLTQSSSKVASEVGDGPRLEEVQEEVQSSDDMDLTNKFVGPDPPEPRHAALPKDRIIFLSPLRLRRLCRTRMLPNDVVLRAAFSHDSVLNAAANGQVSQHDGAQIIAGLCNFYGMDVPANFVPLESEGSVFLDHWQQDERLLMLVNKGWVLVQRRRQRRSQGRRERREGKGRQKRKFFCFKRCVPGRKESFF